MLEIAITAAIMECLSVNAYHEARAEKQLGIIAVTHVVLNRTKSEKFPNSPCKVVYQSNSKGCQFSWFCKPEIVNAPKNRNELNYVKQSVKVAIEMWNKGFDVTNGALYFHAKSVRPSWSTKFYRTVAINNHIFYRERIDNV